MKAGIRASVVVEACSIVASTTGGFVSRALHTVSQSTGLVNEGDQVGSEAVSYRGCVNTRSGACVVVEACGDIALGTGTLIRCAL